MNKYILETYKENKLFNQKIVDANNIEEVAEKENKRLFDKTGYFTYKAFLINEHPLSYYTVKVSKREPTGYGVETITDSRMLYTKATNIADAYKNLRIKYKKLEFYNNFGIVKKSEKTADELLGINENEWKKDL